MRNEKRPFRAENRRPTAEPEAELREDQLEGRNAVTEALPLIKYLLPPARRTGVCSGWPPRPRKPVPW